MSARGIEELLRRAQSLTPAQLDRLGGAWQPSHDAFEAAWRAAGSAGMLPRWHEVWRVAWDATRSVVLASTDSPLQVLDWEGARAAVRDAALALLMREHLTESQFADLACSWIGVMGPFEEEDR